MSTNQAEEDRANAAWGVVQANGEWVGMLGTEAQSKDSAEAWAELYPHLRAARNPRATGATGESS